MALLNVDKDRPTQGQLLLNDGPAEYSAACDFVVSASHITGTLRDFIAPPAGTSGWQWPASGGFAGTINGNTILGNWFTNMGTAGQFSLALAESTPARPPDESLSWPQFREWALREARDDVWFRGHESNAHTLTTALHRTGRRNIRRYEIEDLPRLRRFVEATLGTRYDLVDPDDFGLLLNLAQHHGFPTPLLDFTRSPFVAAYFAYSKLERSDAGDSGRRVRIFALRPLDGDPGRVQTIAAVTPKFAALELGARLNPRALPQQSVNVFSNVVDIEGLVEREEAKQRKKYLRRIDLPATDRGQAMRDLAAMGITAASLFPGLDGVCRSLVERYF